MATKKENRNRKINENVSFEYCHLIYLRSRTYYPTPKMYLIFRLKYTCAYRVHHYYSISYNFDHKMTR